MKRLLLLFFALLLTTLTPQILRAQDTLDELLEDDDNTTHADTADGPQRIGIPAANFELDPNGSGSIAGYCFDEHLIAPMRPTSFNHILAGRDDAFVRTADGRRRSLRDAVRSGEVAVRAMALNVTFVNRTNQPMSVDIARPAVLWDRPAGTVSPLAVAALGAPNASYDARQKAIWRVTSAERRLKSLGYYAGSIYDIDQARLRQALNAFQRDNDLPTTEELNLATIDRIATVDARLRDRLRSVGFHSRDGRFAKEDLGAMVRSYEKFLGLPKTGRWTSDLDRSLATTEGLIPQLNKIRPAKGQQVADVLSGDASGDVLTYVNSGRALMVLTSTPGGVELWNRSGRAYQFAARDEEAIRTIDRAAAKLAERASKDDRVVIYPGVASDGATKVTIGDRAVDVDARELAGFVNGGTIPTALADALSSMVPQATGSAWTGGDGGDRTFVVYRSPLQQGRAAGTLERMGLEQVDGARLAGALDRTYGSRMALYVSDDLRIGAQRYESSMGSLRHDVREMGLAFAE